MNSKLDIEMLRAQFSHKGVITLNDIDDFYREKEPAMPKTTVSWRIYALVQQGQLKRVGRGKYSFGETELFTPTVNSKMKTIGQIINKKFPFISYCQWELSSVNFFSQHLINFNVILVDVERDVINSVYHELKDNFPKVMLVQNLFDNISEFPNTIIVRALVSDSPIQKANNTYVATLEKILVDLVTDKEFVSFQGNEGYTIFRTAFEKYTINKNTMLRYAGRKHKKEEVEQILKTINRQ